MPQSLRDIGRSHEVIKARKKSPLGLTIVDEYEPYFRPLRRKPIRILELGIERARSLRLWRDYFPRATIVGIDNHPKTGRRARHFLHVQGSQDDPAVLDRALELLDGGPTIVIDDCSHRVAPTRFSLTHLWPHLEPGGMYCVEDIHVTWREKWADPNEPGGVLGVVLDCAESMHTRPEAFPGLVAVDIRWRLAVLRKTR